MEWLYVGFLAAFSAAALFGYMVGLRKLLRPIFGDFDPDELTKFLLLGLIFGLIIGIYWTLRPLKDALFQDIVGGQWQPLAKMTSLVVIFPLVMIYSFIVDKLSRKNLFFVMATIYGTATLVIAWYFFDPVYGLANPTAEYGRWLGWIWYWFVESFGSLIIALFWAFATDITSADSAKKGFFFVIMLGQVGGMLIPLMTRIPKWYNISNAYTVVGCGLLIFMIIPLVALFMKTIPPEQMKGFGEKKEEAPVETTTEESKGLLSYLHGIFMGFFEGLWLLISKPYLLGIFGVIAFYEIIVTIFDYIFKIKAETEFLDKAEKLAFLGSYATFTNIATFLCLVFGISKVQKKLGLTASLMLMPLLVTIAVGVFRFYPNLQALFWLMVLSKAVNYALNSPSQKQLYIPTSEQARYKSQAWIESFGGRGAKAGGSFINKQHGNMLRKLGPEWADPNYMIKNRFGANDTVSLWYIATVSYAFLGVIAIWLVVAYFLGRTHKKAVDENRVVC